MRILYLEDNPRDVEVVTAALCGEWPDVAVVAVADRTRFIAELVPGHHDLILSDFRLPDFNGLDALTLALERLPDTPFIFISGTVGEETAAELVRAGAADFVLKDRLHRLASIVVRALRDRDEHLRRRAAEQRVREQAEILNQARDAIIVTNLDDQIVFWNRGAERLFGWTAAETVGRNLVQLLGPASAGDFAQLHHQVGRDGAAHVELPLHDKSHRSVAVEIRASLVLDEHGQPKSRLKIITDVSEKRILEAKFLRAQRLESLGMLAAGIAHDLNNILSPVLMGAPLLRGLATEAADLRVLETIEKSAARGAALVRQILSFAQGSSSQNILIQPKHLLRDIAELIEQTFPKSIALETEIPAQLWTVQGNPTQLHQIFLNLCVNARDAMPRGGQLRLLAANLDATAIALPEGVSVAGRYVVFTVQDNGTGISPENLPRIWDPFFTTKDDEKGTGLGLSTVKGIAANHGGFTTVESTLGVGSIFRIYLPAAEAPDHFTRPPATIATTSPRGRGELLLVVDDEMTIRSLLATILRRDGYRVITAANGIEAAALITPNASTIQLVITDLAMPEMDGFELAAALHNLAPSIRILFMSGAGGPGDRTLPAATITKPFAPEKLLELVRVELDRT